MHRRKSARHAAGAGVGAPPAAGPGPGQLGGLQGPDGCFLGDYRADAGALEHALHESGQIGPFASIDIDAGVLEIDVNGCDSNIRDRDGAADKELAIAEFAFKVVSECRELVSDGFCRYRSRIIGRWLLRHHGRDDEREEDLAARDWHEAGVDELLQPDRFDIGVVFAGYEHRCRILALDVLTDHRRIVDDPVAIHQCGDLAQRDYSVVDK